MEKVSAFDTLERVGRVYGPGHAFMAYMVEHVRIGMKFDILITQGQAALLKENCETKSDLPPCLQATAIATWLNGLA